MKKRKFAWISDCSKAINTIRTSLNVQEAKNKEYRTQISADWSDRTRDEELETLHRQLSDGRRTVRAWQTALHELKRSRSTYNAEFDHLCNELTSRSPEQHLMEAVFGH
jgi:chromosome segregation ATPase